MNDPRSGMPPGAEGLVLVRLAAELSTKAAGTRRRFMRKLVENVRDAMRTTRGDFRVESQWTRIFVRGEAVPTDLRVLSRIPGVSSYSVVVARSRATLEDIVRVGVEHFGALVRGRSYAVRARRSGTHPFRSSDIMRELGAGLNLGARVDLTNPEVEVEVEVRDEDVYFYSGREPGVGGLPLGVEGRAVCLVSGGFDSAVAAWMMLKRGVQLDYVFCNLAGSAYERSVTQVAKILADEWSYGTHPRLHVVPFDAVVKELQAKTQPKYWQLVLKRLMYRVAEMTAHETRAQVIVTGEAIGQVSSQTLSSLAAIDSAAKLPVFRPLIGFDKMDIIEMSRRIGTFDISSKVKEYCAITPGNPATSASPGDLEREDAKLDPTTLGFAFQARRVVDLRGLTEADLVLDYLFTEEVPTDAIVLDLREEGEWEKWHYPGSMLRESWAITADPSQLDRDRTYVVHCEQGAQAAQVAEVLQRAGIEAYAYRGGTAALRRRVEER